MARNTKPGPLMVSDVSMLAARHAAEIDALAKREPLEGREAVRSLVLTMTAIDLKVAGAPCFGVATQRAP